MDRRNFLRLLGGAVVAPKISYFLPPIGGWHSDFILKPNCVVGLDYYPGGRYNMVPDSELFLNAYQYSIYEMVKLKFSKGELVRLEANIDFNVFNADVSGLSTANNKSYTTNSRRG